jgi:hypothetical protein
MLTVGVDNNESSRFRKNDWPTMRDAQRKESTTSVVNPLVSSIF